MPWLRRRSRPLLPDGVAERLPLAPGDAPLAVAKTTATGLVVATEHGLHHLPPGREATSLGWHDIDKAVWRDGTLLVLEAADRSGAGRAHRYPLADPGELPAIVRERVTQSIVSNDKHLLALPSGRSAGVRIVGRRVPGEPELRWRAVLDRDVDDTDPAILGAVQELLRRAAAAQS